MRVLIGRGKRGVGGFLFSVTLTLNTVYVPDRTGTTRMSSPMMGGVGTAAAFRTAPSGNPIIVVAGSKAIVVILWYHDLLLVGGSYVLRR